MKLLIRLAVGLAASLLPFIAAVAVFNWIVISEGEKYTLLPGQGAPEGVDCILVLGAKVWESDRLSHMLEDRMIFGVDLYKNGAAPKLLMSGDGGSGETDAMSRYALEHGVPEGAVVLDPAGFSTYDSVYRARDVYGAKKVILVTQSFHLARAVYIARQLGLEAYGVASDPRTYEGQFYNDARECAARVKDFFMCLVKPKPSSV